MGIYCFCRFSNQENKVDQEFVIQFNDLRDTSLNFTDEIIADKLPADAPRWPQTDGRVKTSAAWLMEHAGVNKGEKLSH